MLSFLHLGRWQSIQSWETERQRSYNCVCHHTTDGKVMIAGLAQVLLVGFSCIIINLIHSRFSFRSTNCLLAADASLSSSHLDTLSTVSLNNPDMITWRNILTGTNQFPLLEHLTEAWYWEMPLLHSRGKPSISYDLEAGSGRQTDPNPLREENRAEFLNTSLHSPHGR